MMTMIWPASCVKITINSNGMMFQTVNNVAIETGFEFKNHDISVRLVIRVGSIIHGSLVR
jgi:1-deoxy-D-xylulose 5-phosphate reductoisomerase